MIRIPLAHLVALLLNRDLIGRDMLMKKGASHWVGMAVAVAVFTCASTLHAAQADNTPARKDIAEMVDTFQSLITAKDGEKLKTMFLPEGSNWWSVLDDTTLASVRQKRPDARRVVPGDFRKFADFIKTTSHSPREDFGNVKIQTDGLVGTVCFDYVFFLDGKKTNHGVETWQVLKTDQGWKISALVYSEIHDKAD